MPRIVKSSMNREYVYSVIVHQKISNEVGKIDHLRALARNVSFFYSQLDIFDIRQHYVRILIIIRCCNDVMNNVDSS